MTWATIMAMHDRAMLTMFGGVCAFAVNWYVFPAARRWLIYMPFVACVTIAALEIVQKMQ